MSETFTREQQIEMMRNARQRHEAYTANWKSNLDVIAAIKAPGKNKRKEASADKTEDPS